MSSLAPMDRVTERQAKFNAATVIARVARRFNRHPATRAVMLAAADRLHEEATALLDQRPRCEACGVELDPNGFCGWCDWGPDPVTEADPDG